MPDSIRNGLFRKMKFALDNITEFGTCQQKATGMETRWLFFWALFPSGKPSKMQKVIAGVQKLISPGRNIADLKAALLLEKQTKPYMA